MAQSPVAVVTQLVRDMIECGGPIDGGVARRLHGTRSLPEGYYYARGGVVYRLPLRSPEYLRELEPGGPEAKAYMRTAEQTSCLDMAYGGRLRGTGTLESQNRCRIRKVIGLSSR